MTVEERERERAVRLVELMWASFTAAINQPFVRPTPELYAMLVCLTVAATRDTYEACLIVEKANIATAIEEEREACAKILDGQADSCEWWDRARFEDIADEIRARSVNPP